MFALPPSLTMHNAAEVERLLHDHALRTAAAGSAAHEHAAAAAVLDIDAGALTQFDSAALAVLIAAQRRLHAHGQVLRLHNVPTRLGELARAYGVDALLGLSA